MTNKQSRRNKRGFVLPLTIAVILLLTVMGLALQSLGLGARMQAARTTAEITARAAADAGLTKAVFEMNQNQNGETWSFSNITPEVGIVLPNAGQVTQREQCTAT
jgi:Tfp pilus assembly protein PilX